MENNTKNSLRIFKKYLNNKKENFLTSKVRANYVGDFRYFPPASKEWKNNIYVFNKNNLKNLPIYSLNINDIIKNYFNLYLNNYILKKRKKKNKILKLNKIYVSKTEIKHTNNKAILTMFVYNREKYSLLKKIKKLKLSFFKKFVLGLKKNKIIYSLKFQENWENLLKDLITLRRYKLKLSTNLYKFEEKFLFKLKNLIIKYFNKKVEFNIVNIKYITLNSEFITKLLTIKIKKIKINIKKILNIFINKAKLAKTNIIKERSSVIKSIDFNLVENKFQSLYIRNILSLPYYNNNNYNKLTKLYKDLFFVDHQKINDVIFNSINYKNLSGIRFEVKGRLTRRNRADRSFFRVKWKGGLKNIDSSYKKLSSINMRGYLRSNLDYSIFTSKRHIGAYAVKGWISGK